MKKKRKYSLDDEFCSTEDCENVRRAYKKFFSQPGRYDPMKDYWKSNKKFLTDTIVSDIIN